MKKGLIILSIFASSIAFGQAGWPPPPTGVYFRWFIVPIDESGNPSYGINGEILERLPDPAASTPLVDSWTDIAGAQGQATFEAGSVGMFWYGPASYLAAAWSQISTGVEAYGHVNQTIIADGEARFKFKSHPRWAFIFEVDRLWPATWLYMVNSVFPGRLEQRQTIDSGLTMAEINNMRVNIYSIESYAISLTATKGLNGPSGSMTYTASGDALAIAGPLNKTIYADGLHLPAWIPEPADYDLIPSHGLDIRLHAIMMYKQPIGPLDTHYKFVGYLNNYNVNPMTAKSHARKESLANAGGIGGEEGGGGEGTSNPVTAADRTTDPTLVQAHAKHRTRMYEMRVMRFNWSSIKVVADLVGGQSPLAVVTFRIKDATTGAVLSEDIGYPDMDLSFPTPENDGSYVLEVSAVGYTPTTYAFSVSNGSTVDAGTLTLYPE